MLNQDIEEKRKIFLEKLEERTKKEKWSKFVGPGIKRKLQRLFFVPNIYVPYILIKKGILKGQKIKKVELFWGKKIYVDIYNLNGFSLKHASFLAGEAELKLTKFFIKNLKEDDIFYDIGANFGFYTALASEFCKEVHSFEPLPDVFQCLKMSFEDNPKIFLNNIALSNKTGETEIFVSNFHSGINTILKEVANKEKIDKILKIKTITLDDYIASGKPKPTVIKLDVEGAESLVIEGGIEFFKNNNPIIAMEVWPQINGGEIAKKAVEKLRNLGYQSFFVLADGSVEKIDGDLSSKINIKPNYEWDNFVFKK